MKIILFPFILCALWRLGYSIPDQSRLLNDLFQNYDVLTRPGQTVDTPTNVTISLHLRYIHGYDIDRGILSIYAWLVVQWTDYRLRWDPFDYGGVTQLQIPHSNLWIPDVLMVNSIDPAVPALPSGRIHALVKSNGFIDFTIPSMFRSPCTRSRQTTSCLLEFCSWTHNGNEINLLKTDNNEIDLSNVKEDQGVKILSTNVTRVVNYYTCCTEGFPFIHFTINIDPQRSHSSGSNINTMSQILFLVCLLSYILCIYFEMYYINV